MSQYLLRMVCFVVLLGACSPSSRNNSSTPAEPAKTPESNQPVIAADNKSLSLMDLPQTQDGGFVLSPGLYEAEFKTYCLQPGTPDPSAHDAYFQAPLTGPRKDIISSILVNSSRAPHIPQRNVQLLLWSVVSGTDYTKLPSTVKMAASELLTPKQIYELKGGVMGDIKRISAVMPASVGGDMRRVLEIGNSSYELIEQVAVLQKPSKITRRDVKVDQWHKQEEGYFVRHFPAGYQKTKIQVYIPDGILDSTNKAGGNYLVFDPTGYLSVPANSDAQRLGIGGPLLDIVRVVIQIEKSSDNKKKKQPPPKPDSKPVKGGVS